MKPAAFDYLRAETSTRRSTRCTSTGDDAKVIAGGQSLMPMLNMRLVSRRSWSTSPLSGLDYIRTERTTLEIGGTRAPRPLAGHALARKRPLLAKALPHIGHFQTRNRGTVCGSLCHSDPSSEIPLCLATLGGQVVLRSKRATRGRRGGLSARHADHRLPRRRDRGRGQLSRRVTGAGYAFAELARRHGDFAIVALAAMCHGTRSGLASAALPHADGAQWTAWTRAISTMRSTSSPGTWAAATTFMPPPATAAKSCAGLAQGDQEAAMPAVSKDQRHPVAFTLNGERSKASLEPRMLLVDFLRHHLGATGTHVGCEHGICGACTVASTARPLRACLTLAVQADGAHRDRRGLGRARRHPVAPAAGVSRELRPAMRLLYARHLDVHAEFLETHRSHREAGARGPQRQYLPLHRLCGDRLPPCCRPRSSCAKQRRQGAE